jgi:hypothetical protein
MHSLMRATRLDRLVLFDFIRASPMYVIRDIYVYIYIHSQVYVSVKLWDQKVRGL